MKRINPNLLKLAHLTYNPNLATPSLEEKVKDVPIVEEAKEIRGYIYVPTLKLYVAEQKILLGNDWYDCHKGLQKKGMRMLTLNEFAEFLKHLKENPDKKNKTILDEIVAVRDPWRSEWIDADFKVVKKKLHINYSHKVVNGNLQPQYSEPLQGHLTEDRLPGINFDYWIEHATSQGLPPQKTPKGGLYYHAPMSDNNSVARFGADSSWAYLDCGGYPAISNSALGVRAVREKI